jgi:hypothetical protein
MTLTVNTHLLKGKAIVAVAKKGSTVAEHASRK